MLMFQMDLASDDNSDYNECWKVENYPNRSRNYTFILRIDTMIINKTW